MSDFRYSRELLVVGPMPPFYEIAYALWGKECDFDSDGDSKTPASQDWRELTLQLRPGYDQRIDIDPLDNNPNKIILRADSDQLGDAVYNFLLFSGAISESQ